jgi:hypothetical protein
MKEFLKIASEINALVLEHNIATTDPKYLIRYSISQAGNMIEVDVHSSSPISRVAFADVWNLSRLNDADADADVVIEKIKGMKKLVKKYIKLNNQ